MWPYLQIRLWTSKLYACSQQTFLILRCIVVVDIDGQLQASKQVALVHSRLDYGNAVLVVIPAHLLHRLQSVLNAAAQLIYHLRPYDHISDALATLHWLRVLERVQYKIAVLTFKALHDSAPRHLGPLVAVADLPGR